MVSSKGPPRGPPGMMRHHRPPYGGPRYPPPGTAGPPSFPYSAPQSPMGSYRPPMGGSPLGFTPITDSPSPPASLPASVFSEREAEESEVVSTPEFPTLAATVAALKGSKQNEVSSSSNLGGREDPEELEYEEEVPSPPPRAKAKPWPEKENKFASTLRRLSTVRKKNKHKKKFRDNKDFASNGGDSGIENAVTTPSSIHEAVRPSSTTSRESDAEALTSGYFR